MDGSEGTGRHRRPRDTSRRTGASRCAGRAVSSRIDAELLALFIAAGSAYKAGPKRTAAEKRSLPRARLPPDEYVWRNDTLRLMFPGRRHSVWLSWTQDVSSRRFAKYFVNLEEPFRRTPLGFDTADHTLDVEVTPHLRWNWRDAGELAEHVKHGFYTPALAREVWNEGKTCHRRDRAAHASLSEGLERLGARHPLGNPPSAGRVEFSTASALGSASPGPTESSALSAPSASARRQRSSAAHRRVQDAAKAVLRELAEYIRAQRHRSSRSRHRDDVARTTRHRRNLVARLSCAVARLGSCFVRLGS